VDSERGQSGIQRAVERLDQRINKLTAARDKWVALLSENSSPANEIEDKSDNDLSNG